MSDDWQLDKKTGSWKKVKKQKSQKDYYYNPRTGSFEKETLTKSKKSGRADNYNPVTGSFEKRLERKSVKVKKSTSKPKKTKKLKKKSKIKKIKKTDSKPRIKKDQKSKMIYLFGWEFSREEYNTFVNECEQNASQLWAGTEFQNYKLKIERKTESKYWNSESIYPLSKNEFRDKFFSNHEPKGLEGLWEEEHWGLVGLVKEQSIYQRYNINITGVPLEKTSGGWGFWDYFHDRVPKENQHFVYKHVSGTKDGALVPTSKKNKYILDARSVMAIPAAENWYIPINTEIKYPVELVEPGLLKIMPPFGNKDYYAKKVWPEHTSNEDIENETKEKSGMSSGTGFFVDNEGHIITNYHVIEPCNNKVKIIYKNKEYKTKLIAKDKNLDLALIKANVKNSFCIKTFDRPIKKLQSVVAAGYPLSNHLGDDLKFTSGIISSLKGFNDDTTQIQIDAALNLGNSGGPIIDKRNGELVAVAVAIHARRDIVEGINFGIKVSQVKDFLYANGIETKQKKLKNKNKNVSTILENSTLQILCQ
tara:strand:+ start:3263 stop:4861 length:1599 start_codon:yes stop_codon:yes gene_type:complete